MKQSRYLLHEPLNNENESKRRTIMKQKTQVNYNHNL